MEWFITERAKEATEASEDDIAMCEDTYNTYHEVVMITFVRM